MALYIPASRRRRRVALVAVVAAVCGLALGLLLGRLTRPSLGGDVSDRQRATAQLIARLDGIALEYQQSGSSGQAGADAREGSLDAARAISADTRQLVDEMPWLSPEQRAAAVSSVDDVRAAIESSGSPEALRQRVDAAEATLRTSAGLPSP